MLGRIRNKAKTITHNLASLDNQPIGKAALTVIIFLDLFILISIFNGLADHAGQLTTPGQYIPQYCRDIVIEGDWNETNRLVRLARIVSNYRGSYTLPNQRERTRKKHPICEPIARLFRSIEDDRGLSANLAEFLRLRQQTVQTKSELERIKSAYDTSLLETIAKQRKGQANVDSLRKEMARKTDSVNKLVHKQELLESSLEQDKRLRDLFGVIESVSEADRNDLRDELRQLNFWYPVKRLGMEMIFLLPLFIVFYFWNAKSISGNRPFQTLVSSHLMVIVFIPVFFKIVELIYDIIPKKLLKHIIELLESLKLVALWHYLLMGITILVALALIYLFQKKLFSREKLIEKRIAKGRCQKCGTHLPLASPACPFCGFKQFKQCSHCNEPTYVFGKYCRECGYSE